MEFAARSTRRIDARFISMLWICYQHSAFERTALDSHANTSFAVSHATAIELIGAWYLFILNLLTYPPWNRSQLRRRSRYGRVRQVMKCGGLCYTKPLFGDLTRGLLRCPNQIRVAGKQRNRPVRCQIEALDHCTKKAGPTYGPSWHHLPPFNSLTS